MQASSVDRGSGGGSGPAPAHPRAEANPPSFSFYEARMARAFVAAVRRARGRRLSIRARGLVRMADLDARHGHLIRASRFLARLADAGLLIRVRRGSARKNVRYVLDRGWAWAAQFWRLAAEDEEEAAQALLGMASAGRQGEEQPPKGSPKGSPKG